MKGGIGISLVFTLYESLVRTLRSEVHGELFSEGRGSVFFFWHRNLIPLPHIFRNKPIHVMVSPSRDGRLIGEIVLRKGLSVVWSSQYKSPVKGVISVLRMLRGGHNVAITPDGPRGPALRFKKGTLEVVKRSGARVVFAGVGFSRKVEVNSWDRMRIPLPFSRVVVLLEEAYPETPEEAEEFLTNLDERAEKMAKASNRPV